MRRAAAGPYIRSRAGPGGRSGGAALGGGETDGQGQAERGGEAFQQRQGGCGAAGLEAGDAGLGHPGPLGERGLGPAEFLPPGTNGLGQLEAQPGLLVGGGRFGAVHAGCPCLGEADTPRRVLAHRHPSWSSSAVWPPARQRAIASASPSISAVSRIFVFVYTVNKKNRPPRALPYEIRTPFPP